MTEAIIHRAQVLLQQQRYAEAEEILKGILSNNPNNTHVLVLLSEVYLQLGQLDKASTLVCSAIGLNPGHGYLFYLKARLSIRKDDYDEAEKEIKQALELDPSEADYYALWASIKLTRKQYQSALDMADRALAINAENIMALNIRSSALIKLDKKEDSFRTIEGALREDPNNAFTHANYGWNLLEKGDHKKALEHFKESLKNDPSNEFAQAGMIEALKAKYLIYRLFLKYSFWISGLTAKYQWGVIIGFYVGHKALRALARYNEGLQPYLTPLIFLMAIIALSTWVIRPISNLFLRLNMYGRHLLEKKDIKSSNLVGLSVLVFILGVGLYFITNNELFILIAAYGFMMMVPFSVMFRPTKVKNAMVYYAIAMAVLGAGGIILSFYTGEMFNMLSTVFVFGFVAFQWIANYLMIREDNV